MTADRYLDILHEYWGYDDFRGIQRQIIESIGSGRDTLGLMPTGGGKSLTFQVPALSMEGVCIVVTPLISLMKDQVMHLRKRGIRAAAVYSGMTHNEILTTLENAVYGGLTLLYVSPERIHTQLFQAKLSHMKVSFLTVDEAHCISQWGYDFRPSYLEIATIRDLLPDIPILALTATATQEVVDDIQEKLHFRQKNVFRMSFRRSNLAYIVRRVPGDENRELVHILKSVPGSAIVYTRDRDKTRELAAMLTRNGIQATSYHARLKRQTREERQDAWQADKVRVMVATNAFGMGIDKPDVRLVVHADPPDSIEAYFQEAGRAGRDGQKAYAVLLFGQSDVKRLRHRLSANYPPKEYIAKVYDCLAYYFQIGAYSGGGSSYNFTLENFCRVYHLNPQYTESALFILQRAGYIDYDPEPTDSDRVQVIVTKQEIYNIELSRIEERVLTVVMRSYEGVFSQYVYVNLAAVAQKCGLTAEQTYMVLSELRHRSIIRYIPQRGKPHLRYAQDRVPSEDLVLPPEVYDQRREQLEKNIESMIAYMQNQEECRGTMLLNYFGEKADEDCGICDVCLHRCHDDSERKAQAIETVKAFFADGKEHTMIEIVGINLSNADLQHALRYLMSEEYIAQTVNGLYVRCRR